MRLPIRNNSRIVCASAVEAQIQSKWLILHEICTLHSAVKNVGALETQNTARAARHALTTRQAAAVLDRVSQPGMPADIDPDRAVEHAHSALNTAGGVRHNLPFNNHLSPRAGCGKQFFYIHADMVNLLGLMQVVLGSFKPFIRPPSPDRDRNGLISPTLGVMAF